MVVQIRDGSLGKGKHPRDTTSLGVDSVGEELVRLAGLRASGDLTDEEFEILKARLVGIEPNAPTPSEQVPIPTAEAVGEDVSAYEMTDWATQDQEAFGQLLVDLGVPHEFDNEGDLIVSSRNQHTVDQVMDDFLDMPDGHKRETLPPTDVIRQTRFLVEVLQREISNTKEDGLL